MPAPYRFVIERPGIPGDAIDGTVFGPWFQPEDQTAPASVATFPGAPAEPTGSREGFTEYSKDDEFTPHLAGGDVQPLIVAVLGTTGGGEPLTGSGDLLSATHTSRRITGTYPDPEDPDDDPFYYMHTADVQRAALVDSLCVRLVDTYWRDAWRTIGWPSNAIGYEVQQAEVLPDEWAPFADVVSAEFDLTLSPAVVGGGLGGVMVRADLNTAWGSGDLTFDLAGLVVSERPSRSLTTAVDDDIRIDGAAVGVDDPGLPATFTLTVDDFSYAPRYTGLVGLWTTAQKEPDVAVSVSFDGDGTSSDVAMALSSGQSVTGVYTIRPPRIRWIYATVPYRRTYPRDDALAGGAPRTWPPSKAVQSSNRTFGGYL